MSLGDLVELARRYGANPQWVPEGRGSVSLKEENTLRITADGVSLADATEESFISLDRRKVAGILRRELPAEPLAREREAWSLLFETRRVGQRETPPADAFLHETVQYACVVHTHPPLINGVACARDGLDVSQRLFGEIVVWVPVASVGVGAARALATGLSSRKPENDASNAPVLAALLQNNGLLLAAESIDQLHEVQQFLIETARSAVRRLPDLSPVAYDAQAAELISLQISRQAEQWDRSGARYRTTILTNREVTRLVRSARAFSPMEKPLCTYHVVPLGHRIPFLSLDGDDVIATRKSIAEAIERFGAEAGWVPPAIAVQGLGMFITGRDRSEMDVTAALLLDAVQIAVYAQEFGGTAPLPQEQIDLYLRWAGSEN